MSYPLTKMSFIAEMGKFFRNTDLGVASPRSGRRNKNVLLFRARQYQTSKNQGRHRLDKNSKNSLSKTAYQSVQPLKKPFTKQNLATANRNIRLEGYTTSR